ncbi:hypothetical protein N0V83_009571 [Neocucurbitaria cava]|uniref:F-box domain-containing protein n=1 Tax=Neocucurbitaria cava TaxID=798079 RepID=A0A9W8XZS2_9PLEO|nr:hypothetical protein N0V83_009571 [Neocucurbitaria cava]
MNDITPNNGIVLGSGDISDPTRSLVPTMSAPLSSTQVPMSQPADRTAPSLLNLPAETRNAIYGFLLLHEEPISVVRSFDLASSSSDLHNFGVSILSTCRQIHYEASGIFYSRNIFQVSQEDVKHRQYIEEAAKWLTDIGRQARLVKLLLLELDQGSFLWNCKTVKLLPILLHLWKHEKTGLAVEFITFEDDLNNIGIRALDEAYERAERRITRANQILRWLVNDPSMSIRRFTRFPRIIRSVDMRLDDCYGRVELYSTSSTCDITVPCMPFEAADNGVPYWIQAEPRLPGLCHILSSPALASKILDFIIPNPMVLTFDVTNRLLPTPVPTVLRVNRISRSRWSWYMSWEVIAKMTTSSQKCSFKEDFENLANCSGIQPYRQSLGINKILVILRFNVAKPLSLEDIRFDATALTKALNSYNEYKTRSN